jgi:hypothetical protein
MYWNMGNQKKHEENISYAEKILMGKERYDGIQFQHIQKKKWNNIRT